MQKCKSYHLAKVLGSELARVLARERIGSVPYPITLLFNVYCIVTHCYFSHLRTFVLYNRPTHCCGVQLCFYSLLANQ